MDDLGDFQFASGFGGASRSATSITPSASPLSGSRPVHAVPGAFQPSDTPRNAPPGESARLAYGLLRIGQIYVRSNAAFVTNWHITTVLPLTAPFQVRCTLYPCGCCE